jgi:mono/diheme cytochrome c family protein
MPQFPAWTTNRALVESLVRSNRTRLQTTAAKTNRVLATTGTAAKSSAPIRVYHLQATQPPGYLAWDAPMKQVEAPAGATNVQFTFWVTNVAPEEVQISYVRSSCGCTTARLPAYPWELPPGSFGPIQLTLDVHDKSGFVLKTVMVNTSTGDKHLLICAKVPTNAANASVAGPEVSAERLRRMVIALSDRQAVFSGECARCHVEPGKGKLGKDLYAAVCGICHESPRRASIVPDPKTQVVPGNRAQARQWVAVGRRGTMMPAFGQAAGGPLSEEQLDSVVDYLIAHRKTYREMANGE